MTIRIAAALALALATQARAEEDCRLKQLATLALKQDAIGQYTIPLTIGGQERRFILGLNVPFSAISGSFADAQGFKSHKLPESLVAEIGGEKIERQVEVSEFAIGPVRAKDYHMFRAQSGLGPDPDVAGVAALDLLENFDVELDLNAQTLKLFSPDHCKGRVVYWADSSAVAPFEIDRSGHIAFEMQLDGKTVSVDFDVTRGAALMPMTAAKRLFDLSETSAGMQPLTEGGTTYYRYPFKSLSLEGIQIANPAIMIYPASGPECRPNLHFVEGREARCFGVADMRLRASELDKLRLYFAFKEKTLYATAAGAGREKAP
jgi:hypothetical protein